MHFWQGFFLYLAPGGLVLAAALAALQHDGLGRWLFGINWLLPPALGLVAVFLAWRFNRSRLLFGALVIFLVDLLLRRYGGVAQIDQLLAKYVFHMAQRDAAKKTSQAVIKAADQALYRAKEGGRNRVSA